MFAFSESYASLPTSLVIAYALAVATSGKSKEIKLAGFDGYEAGDPRNFEMNKLLKLYMENPEAIVVTAITPTCYDIPVKSIYGLTEG
ncbi:hypothetical protein D9M69_717660 [compost metagenome]